MLITTVGLKMSSHRNEGFTILEVLIAITILAFGLLAIATMQVSSIKGNALAIGITEGITLAQDKAEELTRLAYDHALLTDTTDDGGAVTNQDANQNGIDDDDDGNPVDGIAEFGLGQTGVGVADQSELNANGSRYDIYWNVAVNQPITNVKTIRVIVLWTDRGAVKRASVTSMKMDVI
jgi:type IV pilus assembly protein PilV